MKSEKQVVSGVWLFKGRKDLNAVIKFKKAGMAVPWDLGEEHGNLIHTGSGRHNLAG